MYVKKIIFFIVICILYQTTSFSKSISFDRIDSKIFSKYFSGIIASEINDNSKSLEFFEESKILLKKHDLYLKKYIQSLVLENKIPKAIKTLKKDRGKENLNFFEAYLLLIIDSIKNGDFEKANIYLSHANNSIQIDRIDKVVFESLKQYIFVFKEKKFLKSEKNFGNLSLITKTFQSCYLNNKKTDNYFSNLIKNEDGDYSRYLYFYLSYLVDNNRINDAKIITKELNYINNTLLLSQGKNWVENDNFEKFFDIFSCKNHNDIISEFLFLISNLYSSQDDFRKSNFYLTLSNFLNPKFVFNLSLVAENQMLNEEYGKARKTLKNFSKEDIFYHWYKVKKEAEIIANETNKEDSLRFIVKEFNRIDKPNKKILFDMANFYKSIKKYDEAIKYYSILINFHKNDSEIKSDLLYRRGGSYERMGNFEKADIDLLNSLEINSDDAYVLNYLAYSWLERNFKIKEAIKMLETAYKLENNDPYIIDSIGWAYFLVDDYFKAEEFMKRAVELMPDDPIVNDHYGDILWKLNRKIQARYFWTNVLGMENAEKDMIKRINDKIVQGLKNS